MKLSEVITEIPVWFEDGTSIHLVSPPGMGKTDTMMQAPAILDKAFGGEHAIVVIQGPLLTPGDAVGYLMPRHCEDGRIESAYSEPYWYRTREGRHIKEFKGGIIFVDEIDKADIDVKKVLGECTLSGRLGPHQIPPGFVVWSAGNRSEDRSGSTKELDHLINRRQEVPITPDLPSLLDWCDAHGVSPLMKSFFATYPEIVLAGKVPDKQGPWCTPRSAVSADRYLQLKARQNGGVVPTDPVTVESVAGRIGTASMQLFSHVKLELEMPSYKSIVAAPDKVKVPKEPGAMMLVCYKVAHEVSAADAAAVITYIDRFPKEFAVTFAKAAVKRDNKLAIAPAFQKWASTNSALMAIIN